MANTYTIFAVDDDGIDLSILKYVLEDQPYSLNCFSSPQDCLSVLETTTPDLLLTDVIMSKDNGFSFCQRIKQNPKFQHLPVVFMSDLDNLEDIMAGYQSGGSYCIAKPFEAKNIIAIIDVAIENYQKSKRIERKIQYSNAKPHRFSASSYLDDLLKFFQGLAYIRTFDQLAQHTFQLTQKLELPSSLIFHTYSEDYYYRDDGIDRPLEKKLMLSFRESLADKNYHHSSTKFLDREPLILASFDKSSLLVRNVPEPTKKTIKNLLVTIGNCLELCIGNLCHQFELKQGKSNHMQALLTDSEDEVLSINKKFKTHEKKVLNMMNKLMLEISNMANTFDLKDTQQQMLSDTIERQMSLLLEIYSQGTDIQKSFTQLLQGFTYYKKTS